MVDLLLNEISGEAQLRTGQHFTLSKFILHLFPVGVWKGGSRWRLSEREQ